MEDFCTQKGFCIEEHHDHDNNDSYLELMGGTSVPELRCQFFWWLSRTEVPVLLVVIENELPRVDLKDSKRERAINPIGGK